MNSNQRANSNSEVEIIESDNNEIFELIDSDLENIDSTIEIIEIDSEEAITIESSQQDAINQQQQQQQTPFNQQQQSNPSTQQSEPVNQHHREDPVNQQSQPESVNQQHREDPVNQQSQPESVNQQHHEDPLNQQSQQPNPSSQQPESVNQEHHEDTVNQQSQQESDYEQESDHEQESLPHNVWQLPNLIPRGNMIVDALPGTSTSVARILQTFSFGSISDVTHINFRSSRSITRLGSLSLNLDSVNENVMINAKNRIALDLLRDKTAHGFFDVTKLIRIFKRALHTNDLFAIVEMLTFRTTPLKPSRSRVLSLRDGRYFIKSRGSLIFSPLVKLLQLNVTVSLPDRSTRRRIFPVDFVEHTSYSSLIESIEDEVSNNVIGIFFLEFLFVFDKDYEHLLYTYRISGYYLQLFMPRYAFKLSGVHNILYQLKCCRRLSYN
jgi:hypothetical protein